MNEKPPKYAGYPRGPGPYGVAIDGPEIGSLKGLRNACILIHIVFLAGMITLLDVIRHPDSSSNFAQITVCWFASAGVWIYANQFLTPLRGHDAKVLSFLGLLTLISASLFVLGYLSGAIALLLVASVASGRFETQIERELAKFGVRRGQWLGLFKRVDEVIQARRIAPLSTTPPLPDNLFSGEPPRLP